MSKSDTRGTIHDITLGRFWPWRQIKEGICSEERAGSVYYLRRFTKNFDELFMPSALTAQKFARESEIIIMGPGAYTNFSREEVRQTGILYFGYFLRPNEVLDGLDLREVPIYDSELNGAIFTGARLYSTHLWNCKLQGAVFEGAIFSPRRFRGDANTLGVSGFHLGSCDASNADFTGCFLRECQITSSKAEEATFLGADLEGCWIHSSNFKRADFQRSILSAASLLNSDFSGANFSGADLRDTELTSSTFEGATFEGADLRGADLSGAEKLRKAYFYRAVYDGETKFPMTFDELTSGAVRKW